MFLEFYKLREQPFSDTPDPRFVFPSRTHSEALASLFYGIETGRGFLAFIAEPGMGKTTLLFRLLERLRGSARTVFLCQTQCNSRELLEYLLADLGIDSQAKGLVWMHEQLKEVLLGEAKIGRHFVVFIDEAQILTDSTLEAVRLLSNFETPRAKLMQIVLVGQPQLQEKLAQPALAQLRQRISIVSRLEPFTHEESSAYIDHRLQIAGYKGGRLFTPEARAMIAAWSGGVPRKINNLCFNALTLGYALGRAEIDLPVVQEAANDFEMTPFISAQHGTAQIRKPTTVRTSTNESMKESAKEPVKEPLFVPALAPIDSLQDAQKSASTGAQKAPSTEQTVVANVDQTVPPQFVAPVLASERKWKLESAPDLFEVPFARGTEASSSPTSRRIMLVAAAVFAFFVFGVAGVFSLNHSSAQSPAIPLSKVASPVSSASTVVAAPDVSGDTSPTELHASATDATPRVTAEPTSAADAGAVDLQPTSPAPELRKPVWARKIWTIPPYVATPSSETFGRDVPPAVASLPSNAPSNAIQRIVPSSSNVPVSPLNSQQASPIRAGDRIGEPQVVFRVSPSYPAPAKLMGIEGNVVIDAVIDRAGNVSSTKVVSGPVALRSAASDAVQRWKYMPTFLDGKSVPVETLATVEFHLH
jgi:TonB family protein